jgi:hypothetical protein
MVWFFRDLVQYCDQRDPAGPHSAVKGAASDQRGGGRVSEKFKRQLAFGGTVRRVQFNRNVEPRKVAVEGRAHDPPLKAAVTASQRRDGKRGDARLRNANATPLPMTPTQFTVLTSVWARDPNMSPTRTLIMASPAA